MRVNIHSEGLTARRGTDGSGRKRVVGLAADGDAVRVYVLGLLVLLVFGVFVRRLWHLQFALGHEYTHEAREQSTELVTVPAWRGIIYDRGGERLVRNVPSFQVTVVPAYLPREEEQRKEVIIRLAVLLDLPYTAADTEEGDDRGPGLREMIEGTPYLAPYRPIVIKRNLERDMALVVAQETSNLPGVAVEVESVREYPYGPLVSQLVGYLLPISPDREEAYRAQGYDPATDRVGIVGVEATYEDRLRGQKGEQLVETDVLGRALRVVEDRAAPVPGDNVYLTLDLDLQQAAEAALTQGLEEAGSPRGVAVAMNPQSGEILAMVSLPTYDNNVFVRGVSQSDLDEWDDVHRPLFNHAVQVAVPPGSVFKVVVAAAALQEGVATSQTTLQCPGQIVVPNRYYPNDPGYAQPFFCWNRAGHGALQIVEGIAQSCNIFFYKVGGGFDETGFEGLGVGRIAEYARVFGMGEPTGVELVAESGGLVPSADWKRHTYRESWSTGDTYNLSIGQGFLEVTPLQLLNAVNALANNGTLYRPRIVHHVTDADGRVIEPFEPEVVRAIPVDEGYLALVRAGMEGAVAHGTAARRGQIEDLGVAGKTGTAQFCDDIMCGVGFDQAQHAWYTAFAPVEEPEISVVVFLYNGGEGSVTAVPVAREILAHYFGVAPEDEIEP